MNILVTSGGTTEKIDAVRSISNMSTGKLGSLIADCFADKPGIDKIFYICNRSAVKPNSNKAEIIHIDDVLSLETAIKTVLSNTCIDIIVHCMAVSDYRVGSVLSASSFIDLVISNLDTIKELNNQDVSSQILSLLKNSELDLCGDGKISSNIDNMLLFMERTPKIISLFQSFSPKSTLVGFKLLNSVPLEKLIDSGYQILTKNKCSFVLANDLKDISNEQHIGYLIDKDRNYVEYSSKSDIASAIVDATIRKELNQF
ncbi:MAG: phosphopantothenate--cysteine ligase [Defluviitaleaceae bacterium]|nr:phosphopantothenate--cysteine ligase [Defluviitaleaceae bacterium]